MSTCPLHHTPLNGNGECLPCAFMQGEFEDRFEGRDKTDYNRLKEFAINKAKETVDEALKEIESQEGETT